MMNQRSSIRSTSGHSSFHPAQDWIATVEHWEWLLDLDHKYLADLDVLDDEECVQHQQRDTKKGCWWSVRWKCWFVYLSLAPSPGHPHEPGSHHCCPPLLLICRLVYLPSAMIHINQSVPRRLTRWARGSSLSSRAKVTSVNSHCEIHLPSVKVKLSEQLVEIN